MSSQKSKQPKKDKDIQHWCELYIQAHLDDKRALKRIFGDIIVKLGGTLPKLPPRSK